MTRTQPVRVLLIDDDPLYRRTLAAALDAAAGLHALACGADTATVRDQLMRLHPDVIVLALELRTADALVLLHKLRTHYPVPVIVTAGANPHSAALAAQAVARGALEVVPKSAGVRPGVLEPYAHDLALRIGAAARLARPTAPFAAPVAAPALCVAAGIDPRRHVVVVGASTGGTEALAALVRCAPADFPPIAIVQHMPVGFTRSFAERLNTLGALRVSEAMDGEALHPGCAVLARGDTHLTVRRSGQGWTVRYTDQVPVNRHCPSVDVLFESAAASVGAGAAGILLSGMGADGARGLLRLRQAGAVTAAQSRDTCVVYGMPKVAVELGAAEHMGGPEEMPGLVLHALRERQGVTARR